MPRMGQSPTAHRYFMMLQRWLAGLHVFSEFSDVAVAHYCCSSEQFGLMTVHSTPFSNLFEGWAAALESILASQNRTSKTS